MILADLEEGQYFRFVGTISDSNVYKRMEDDMHGNKIMGVFVQPIMFLANKVWHPIKYSDSTVTGADRYAEVEVVKFEVVPANG